MKKDIWEKNKDFENRKIETKNKLIDNTLAKNTLKYQAISP